MVKDFTFCLSFPTLIWNTFSFKLIWICSGHLLRLHSMMVADSLRPRLLQYGSILDFYRKDVAPLHYALKCPRAAKAWGFLIDEALAMMFHIFWQVPFQFPSSVRDFYCFLLCDVSEMSQRLWCTMLDTKVINLKLVDNTRTQWSSKNCKGTWSQASHSTSPSCR